MKTNKTVWSKPRIKTTLSIKGTLQGAGKRTRGADAEGMDGNWKS